MTQLSFCQGGDDVWGNATFAPDDLDGKDHSHGELIAFRESVVKALENEHLSNLTAHTTSTWVLERTPSYFQVGPQLRPFRRLLIWHPLPEDDRDKLFIRYRAGRGEAKGK